jgi:hypothetical protein
MERRVMGATVRVPWVVGTTARSGPRVAEPAPPDRPTRCAAKAARVEADIAELEGRRASVGDGGDPRQRERLEAEVAFQRRRLEWLAAYAVASREDLEARLAVIHDELGEDGRGYLVRGLPPQLARDQRLMSLLGEAAVITFALEAQ